MFDCLFGCKAVWLFGYLLVRLSTCLFGCLFVLLCLSIAWLRACSCSYAWFFVCLVVCLFVCLIVWLFAYLVVWLSTCLLICWLIGVRSCVPVCLIAYLCV